VPDQNFPREAVVLAGGLGTRLRSVVSDVPKPLAPVAGRPFLHWLLEGFARQGILRIVLATGYMAGSVSTAIGPRFAGMEIVFSPEAQPLGTGGAIWAALRHCEGRRAFVANGDSWIGADLARLATAAPSADIVLSVRKVPDRARYGSVIADGDRMLGLAEKGGAGPGLVNAGLYVMRCDLPERHPVAGAFSLETTVLAWPGVLDIRLCPTEAPFLDIGTPDDFAAAQALIPAWAAA
jgi:D-glycero-alpha-D-manno-heptose 1-phosphate guanylyltransferase